MLVGSLWDPKPGAEPTDDVGVGAPQAEDASKEGSEVGRKEGCWRGVSEPCWPSSEGSSVGLPSMAERIEYSRLAASEPKEYELSNERCCRASSWWNASGGEGFGLSGDGDGGSRVENILV